jgi:hypothetical protein
MFPVAGEPLDAADIGISAVRGDTAGAGLSGVAMLPFGGQSAGAANLVIRADRVLEGLKALEKVSDAAPEAAARGVDAAARGLSTYGGTFAKSTNEAGGELWLSTGEISQLDFRTYVNSGMYKGNVHVLSGAHGFADGTMKLDADMFLLDQKRFNNLAGVHVYNIGDMSPDQLSDVLRGEGTIIGGFCNSAACLEPYFR